MNIIIWIMFGAVAGIIAHVIDRKPAQGGLIGAIAFGVFGALTGGILANTLFDTQIMIFDVASSILAITVSLFLLLIHRTALSF